MAGEASANGGVSLRLARQASGFSQQQLATMAGVSRQALSAVESGRSDPSLRVALALARMLGMSVEELFGPSTPTVAINARPVARASGALPIYYGQACAWSTGSPALTRGGCSTES